MLFKDLRIILESRISPKDYLINGENYGLEYGQATDDKLIKRILLTADLNLESIHFAIVNKINLILSYNSLISVPIKKFNNILIKKLTLLSKLPILIFPLNSSLIGAEGGISDTIVDMLYLQLEQLLEVKNCKNLLVPIGRICSPKNYPKIQTSFNLEGLLNRIKSNLSLGSISFVGDLNSEVKRICVIGSEISDWEYLKKARKIGCDCFISGTINNKFAIIAKELDLNLIQIPLYSFLNITFKKLTQVLSIEFPYDDFIFYEIKELIKFYN